MVDFGHEMDQVLKPRCLRFGRCSDQNRSLWPTQSTIFLSKPCCHAKAPGSRCLKGIQTNWFKFVFQQTVFFNTRISLKNIQLLLLYRLWNKHNPISTNSLSEGYSDFGVRHRVVGRLWNTMHAIFRSGFRISWLETAVVWRCVASLLSMQICSVGNKVLRPASIKTVLLHTLNSTSFTLQFTCSTVIDF